MNTFIAGTIQQFWLWVSFFSFAFKRPKGVGLLSAINPIGTSLFNDSIHKVCGHLGIKYSPVSKQDFITSVMRLPDGNRLIFYWRDRAEVGKTVDSIYKDKVYGDPIEGVTIDVGAHIGIYSLFASMKSKVYAIEPDMENYVSLLANSSISSIEPHNIALGLVNDEVELYSDYLSTMRSIDGEGESQPVKMMTLVDFCRENYINYIDMIKMDVEGYEMKVLFGAYKLLNYGRISNLAIASYHYPRQVDDVKAYLEQFGYTTEVFKRGGEITVFGRLEI